MKFKVERCLECARAWVVLDPHGRVVYETTVWAWAVDDAIARYSVEADRKIRALVS